MITSITPKSITALAAAALGAVLVVFLMSAVPEAKAEPPNALNAKGNRLPMLVMGSACSSRSWPNYDHSCQFDLRKPTDEARVAVRIIAIR